MHEASERLATRPQAIAQLKRFLAVGLTAVGVDSLVFFVLSHLGQAPALAKGLSFVSGSVVAFLLNKYVTFVRPHFQVRELWRFGSLYLSTLGANVAVFGAVSTATAARWPWLCFLLATGTSTVMNYLGQRYWVFVDCAEQGREIFRAYTYRARDYMPALFCAVSCAGYLWGNYPTMFRNGEIWAEAAVNYFANARSLSLVENLFVLDFSYLPLFVRLWAMLVQSLGIPAAWVPVAYQSIALVIISACVAFFALPWFRILIASDTARVFVCAGIALCPDYEVKAFINFSYFLAIVFYLTLAWYCADTNVSRRRALLCGGLLLLAALSKPHFLSFAPILAVLTCLSIYRRQGWATLMLGLPLTGCLAQLLIAVMHRGQIDQAGPVPFGQVLSLSARWVPIGAVHQLVGRALLSPKLRYTVFAIVFGVLLVSVAWIRRRQWLTQSAWPLAIAFSTLCFGVFLSVAPYPDRYEPYGGHYPVIFVGGRHFFVPMLAIYLAFAITMARMLPRRWSPWLIALWLPLSYPFGWHHKGRDLGWPVANASSWQGFTSHVFAPSGGAPARGCIPINPHPWHFTQDCQVLADLENSHAHVLAPVAESYPTPPNAAFWHVDAVGMRLSEPHTGDRMLVAYDAENRELGRGVEIEATAAYLTHFYFPTPIARPKRVALLAPASPALSVVVDKTRGQPNWIWLGRMLPTPQETSSQAAR